MSAIINKNSLWRMSSAQWAGLGILSLLLIVVFYAGLQQMVGWWLNREEYSHGILIPLIALFLIWQKKERLEKIPFTGSWAGFAIAVFGIICFFLGELSTLYTIIQYGFLITLVGAVLALLGREAFKEIWVPMAFLVFMIPLPNFIYNNLSSELQLISSQIGVAVIRLFDISVHLQGNVIDLGNYKLQVVEACSGLRYLFPLLSLAFLCAYLFKAPLWQRAVIFLSSIPITVLMNSFRIGVIGVLVEHWGVEMAEGFLHDFEGWVVFMACMGILIAEMWLFSRLSKPRRPWHEVFGLYIPPLGAKGPEAQARPVTLPFFATLAVIAIALVAGLTLQKREEVIPTRLEFATFPLSLNSWQGKETPMEQMYIDALKFDDYLLADFTSAAGERVNFYVAYYGSQRTGESAHSPRSCIPGDGWRIESLTVRQINATTSAGVPLKINRAIIAKGEYKQLVYYWFQQRGRIITNEYLVKWYLFWDALTRNRTDGALVRLTTFVKPGEDIQGAEHALENFSRTVIGELDAYVPGKEL